MTFSIDTKTHGFTSQDCKAFIEASWAERPRTKDGFDLCNERHIERQAELQVWFDRLGKQDLEQLSGRGVVSISLEQCAALAYRAVWEACRADGDNPSWETFATSPDQTSERGFGSSYMVCWESGPSDWGIYCDGSSMVSNEGHPFEFPVPKSHYLETYWGFDVLFCQ